MPVRFATRLLLVLLLALALLRFTPAPQPRATPPAPPKITLLGVGDILLGRQLAVEMEKTNDYALPFRSVRHTLSAADIAFGNLEGPFCEQPPYPARGMTFRFRPRSVESLLSAGFDVVSVANNHFGDGGDACMHFSLQHLRGNAIQPVGAGATFDEAHTAAIIERKGVRFAFLAYTYARQNDSPGSMQPVIAGRDAEQARHDISAARAKADVVVVSLHDGAEYKQSVADETRKFAQAAIEAGATIVLGHHPHVPQPVERHHDGWIFYSLGNFAFQQRTPPAVRTALMARLTFSGGALETVEAIPVVIEHFARPRFATQEEAAGVLKSVGLFSPRVWCAADAKASAVSP